MIHRQLFLSGDPYQNSDVGFAVKKSLIVDANKVDDQLSLKYNVPEGSDFVSYEFILVAEEDVDKLRHQNATKVFEQLQGKVQIVNGLPVADVE